MANYPLPSTVNVANFVSVRPLLRGEDRSIHFGMWKEQMVCLLESQGLMSFVEGQIPPLSEESPEHILWKRTDKLIKGWILGSIGNDALAMMVGLSSSKEVWLKLRDIFNQNQASDSSENREGEGDAVAVGGVQNTTAGDEDGIVVLQSQTTNNVNVPQQNNGTRTDYTKYLPLRRAITKAEWNEARRLLETNIEAKTAIISEINETSLLVAVTIGKKSNAFVRELLQSMPNDALAIRNSYGNTALHRAAMIGNRETVVMLVTRNHELLYITNKQDCLPVHIAAVYCHKGILEYLIGIHKKHTEERPSNGQELESVYQRHIDKSPFDGQLGASLLLRVIISQFIGIILTATASDNIDDIVNLSANDEASKNSWFEIIYKIPYVKSIRDKKVMHQQALKLVNCVCKALESLPSSIYERALLLAAHNGINEVVEVIMEMFPTTINIADTKNEGNIFHVAARGRSENVFNLFHKMKEGKHFFYDSVDTFGNNYMHMCGEQAPAHKLNLVSGAALQMQYELQWFKASKHTE
ncbi:uncharacterized protein [Henckelia pumila]|uniref:uncharacterized protein n=1 Tax=Henckelia pumila TaxID=405737 RepID=UPI003C6DDCEE